jgi:hypothetical protein
MVVSSAGLGPKSEFSGQALKQLYESITDPSSRQRGCHKTTNLQLSKENFNEKEKIVYAP